MKKSIINLQISIDQIKKVHVTGFKYNSNKRFKRLEFNSIDHALMINLWKGSVWVLLENGKRKLIKRINN